MLKDTRDRDQEKSQLWGHLLWGRRSLPPRATGHPCPCVLIPNTFLLVPGRGSSCVMGPKDSKY